MSATTIGKFDDVKCTMLYSALSILRDAITSTTTEPFKTEKLILLKPLVTTHIVNIVLDDVVELTKATSVLQYLDQLHLIFDSVEGAIDVSHANAKFMYEHLSDLFGGADVTAMLQAALAYAREELYLTEVEAREKARNQP